MPSARRKAPESQFRRRQAALEAGTDSKIVKQRTDEVVARQVAANAQLAASVHAA
jgi:hypothetical protein